ncbi:hypothetical protein GGS23DRAFT_615660 [Durotheca rogersii]|uniref:uncharacterized protein n=1 Tax=Durotheca rogersii TaxID=419775 RepID=UPI00221EC121|nr:uncharacterized protein GGS23DRAFT_615660 [Durotheca rogersii]KAI5866998.1 hypothetical protein GGS23DRAFT_615660 [Durotheca rogersii]
MNLEDVEEGRAASESLDPYQQTHNLLRHIARSFIGRWNHHGSAQPHSAPNSFLSDVPRTSPERLARAAVGTPDSNSELTVLYLAYGSNLSSSTFLRFRGIRPISQVNVSAPGLDLSFDLPGLPYWEPCFANVVPRKLPKPPLPIPGDPPKLPLPPAPPARPSPPSLPGNLPHVHPPLPHTGVGWAGDGGEVQGGRQPPSTLLPALPPAPPVWHKGLYGVVYEVTAADYATIMRTEGGGAAYLDVLTPCIALPPALRIPEKPPIPEPPAPPFVAHTLLAPRLPAPPDDDDDDGRGASRRSWWTRLLLPIRRPDPDYAQPSPRYLGHIRDGAREHCLPDDYQAHLARLAAYAATTRRQRLGRWLLLLAVAPPVALLLALGALLADGAGTVPRWLAAAETVLLNLVWIVYDRLFKQSFGDGEHTIDDEDGGGDGAGQRGTRAWRRSDIVGAGSARGSEKSALLADW